MESKEMDKMAFSANCWPSKSIGNSIKEDIYGGRGNGVVGVWANDFRDVVQRRGMATVMGKCSANRADRAKSVIERTETGRERAGAVRTWG